MYNTGNDIPSAALEDMADNAQVLDQLVNKTDGTVTGRTGTVRRSFQQIIMDMGFEPLSGSFQSGATLTQRNQVLQDETTGVFYSWNGALPKVVTAGSTPATSGGISSTTWVDRTDLTLRGELTSGSIIERNSLLSLRDFISVKDFGATGDGITDDTIAILSALVYAKAINSAGVELYFPNGKYIISQKILLDSANLRLVGQSRWGTRLDSMGAVLGSTIEVNASSCDVSNMFIASNSADNSVYLKGGNNFTSDRLVCKAGAVGILHETGNCSWITKFYAESCGIGYKMAPTAASNCNGSYVQGRAYNCEIGFDLNTNGSSAGPGMNEIHFSCEANTIGFRELYGRYNNLFIYSESNVRASTQGNTPDNFLTNGLPNFWMAGNPSNDTDIIKGSGYGWYSFGGSIFQRNARTPELKVTTQTGTTMTLSDPDTAIWYLTNQAASTGTLTLGFMSYMKLGQKVRIVTRNTANGWMLAVPSGSGFVLVGLKQAGVLFGAYVTSGYADILTITKISDTEFLSEFLRGTPTGT